MVKLDGAVRTGAGIQTVPLPPVRRQAGPACWPQEGCAALKDAQELAVAVQTSWELLERERAGL